MNECGNTNSSRRRKSLKSHRNVHSIAIDVGAILDNISEVDADPNPRAVGQIGDGALDIECRLYGGRSRGQHDRSPISHQLYDLTAVAPNRWIECL